MCSRRATEVRTRTTETRKREEEDRVGGNPEEGKSERTKEARHKTQKRRLIYNLHNNAHYSRSMVESTIF